MTTWRLLPEDLFTHLCDWRKACEIALEHAAYATVDTDDPAYWQKQLDTLDQIESEMEVHIEARHL